MLKTKTNENKLSNKFKQKKNELITLFTCKLQGFSDLSTSLDEVEELQSLFSLSV